MVSREQFLLSKALNWVLAINSIAMHNTELCRVGYMRSGLGGAIITNPAHRQLVPRGGRVGVPQYASRMARPYTELFIMSEV